MKTRNSPTRQMENEQGSDSAPAATESKKTQRSKREFLDTTGAVTTDTDNVAGARYALLIPGAEAVPFDRQLPTDAIKPGSMDANFWALGYLTKMGNNANTLFNGDEPATPTDAAAALRKWLDGGVWSDRESGGGGGYDYAALANSIVTVATAAGKQADYATILQKVTEDAAYRKGVMTLPAVREEYNRRIGRETKSIDAFI